MDCLGLYHSSIPCAVAKVKSAAPDAGLILVVPYQPHQAEPGLVERLTVAKQINVLIAVSRCNIQIYGSLMKFDCRLDF